MDQLIDISVIVPVFNSEKTLSSLISRLENVLSELEVISEIILVDDASKDKSWDIIKEIKKKSSIKLTAIRLARNYGQHSATLAGLARANGNFMITLDDDLEYFPEDIHLLLEKQQLTNADVVYGLPTSKNISHFRKLLISFYRFSARLTKSGGKGSSYRLINKKICNSIVNHSSSFVFLDEFFRWYTDKIEFVTVNHQKSMRGKSRYSILDLLNLTSNLVFISSNVPLRIVTFFGTFLMATNFLVGIYFIIRKLFFSIPVEGYVSLIVSILFSTGMILLSLGIIAQYISKILIMSYNKPAFSESEVI